MGRNYYPRFPAAVKALWQGLPTLPPGRPKFPSLTCGLRLRSGNGGVWRPAPNARLRSGDGGVWRPAPNARG
jgi:hypothetical protein